MSICRYCGNSLVVVNTIRNGNRLCYCMKCREIVILDKDGKPVKLQYRPIAPPKKKRK